LVFKNEAEFRKGAVVFEEWNTHFFRIEEFSERSLMFTSAKLLIKFKRFLKAIELKSRLNF
jgi:hypothetical protein